MSTARTLTLTLTRTRTECNGLLLHVSADFGEADGCAPADAARADAQGAPRTPPPPPPPPCRRAVLLLEPFPLAVEARGNSGGGMARTARLTVMHNGMRIWARPPPPTPTTSCSPGGGYSAEAVALSARRSAARRPSWRDRLLLQP